MDAVDTLFNSILTRITDLALFGQVEPALNGGQLILPSAEIWLEEMRMVWDTPEITYDLSYTVQVTVGYREDGSAQSILHQLLAALRATFSGWEPEFIGVLEASVPTIKIASHEDHGKTVYLVQILLRVSLDTFSAI